MSKVVFVSVPSYGVFTKNYAERWDVYQRFLEDLAQLHVDRPHDVFIAPSLQNYAILPYLPEHGPTYDTWKERCRLLMCSCDEVHVLRYKLWERSVGVKDEIEHAKFLRIPVTYSVEKY